jgi:precorrin-6B methylase 2
LKCIIDDHGFIKRPVTNDSVRSVMLSHLGYVTIDRFVDLLK